MFALITDQGTAVSIGLCFEHYKDSALRDEARVLSSAGWQDSDVAADAPFVDCTGNDEVQCFACPENWTTEDATGGES